VFIEYNDTAPRPLTVSVYVVSAGDQEHAPGRRAELGIIAGSNSIFLKTNFAKEKAMANEGYHESIEELSDETRDMHRAIISLMEELEAVDWYNQRVDACKDRELAAILAHNRDEEKEHAAMVLEWIRRRDPRFDKELKDYLFTTEEIAHE
jgi:ferritin-like protein